MEIENLITSHTGIGEMLISELIRKGESVFTLFPSPKDVPMSFLGKINLKYGFVKLDQDLNIEKGLPRKVKNIFHIYEVYSGPFTKIFMANTTATLFLLEWAKKVGASKFILISTGEVYGSGDGINESTPYNPKSFYATTKFYAETLTRYYNKVFEVKILRVFYPYGKNLNQGYIYNLLEALNSTGIIETEYSTICPTLIDDLVEPLIKSRDLPGNALYNICGTPIPLFELIKEIESITGKNAKKINIGKTVLCGDATKARTEIGYRETPFKEGISFLKGINK
jgi:nucleoside-diphosphate-sugar epimerase|uniref:NAD(P)-dependent oxidoreductase n=1 Tax=candidate division WOR-3 bacterium TaxID=2052148 RepID=A0A7V3RID4_UNCW3